MTLGLSLSHQPFLSPGSTKSQLGRALLDLCYDADTPSALGAPGARKNSMALAPVGGRCSAPLPGQGLPPPSVWAVPLLWRPPPASYPRTRHWEQLVEEYQSQFLPWLVVKKLLAGLGRNRKLADAGNSELQCFLKLI